MLTNNVLTKILDPNILVRVYAWHGWSESVRSALAQIGWYIRLSDDANRMWTCEKWDAEFRRAVGFKDEIAFTCEITGSHMVLRNCAGFMGYGDMIELQVSGYASDGSDARRVFKLIDAEMERN